ncbi:hypothetical protein Tco_0468416 [Tanacetum coccineum]
MLHQRMFESGTYKSHHEHIALYEALEASMAQAQRDKFLAEKDKSRKRRRDDQDPPPPPPDSDLSKRRRHDTGASGSSQPPAPYSSSWKKSDTRDAPSSSVKQQSGPHDEQPVEDMPILDSANISDSEDTEDDRPATLEPAWVIPTSHVPDAENNWANALATTYQALTENSLLVKTGDMRTFINWYCQKMGKTKLTQADLEDQIDWVNPEGDQVRIDISKPLPLGGPPGHVTIQTKFFFNHDLDYLRYGSKESGQALSISKMKAARYHDFGLELFVPEHMWIDDLNQRKNIRVIPKYHSEDGNPASSNIKQALECDLVLQSPSFTYREGAAGDINEDGLSIEECEKSRANLDSAGSSEGNTGNAGGTVNVQGCSHKTFMNGKPHPFNGTKGVVGLRPWIEKEEQVFEICKCAEEDKVMFAANTFEGRRTRQC